MRRFWMILTVFFFAFLTSACAPTIYPMGPEIQQPAIGGDAFIMADGAKLPLKMWPSNGPPKAIVLGLHGFNDYANAYLEPATTWAESGILTYAYDQRGFGGAPHRGKWAGVDTMVGDAVEISRLLKIKYPNIPLVLVGESMGGAIALNAMQDDGLMADRIILSAPAVWGRQVMPWYQRWPLWLAAHTVPSLTLRPRLKITPSDNVQMLRALGRDPLIIKSTRIESAWGLTNLMEAAYEAVPNIKRDSLILYGKREDLIPENAWNGVISRLPEDEPKAWRLALYDNGYHMLMRDLQADVVLADIVSYILDKDADLPSGHEVIEE